MSQGVGSHILLDIWFVPGAAEELSLERWQRFLDELCTRLGMQVLGRQWHNFGAPGAYTLLWLLGTSHASIHTWPERNYVAFDLFTCEPGLLDAAVVLASAQELTGIDHIDHIIHRRGAHA